MNQSCVDGGNFSGAEAVNTLSQLARVTDLSSDHAQTETPFGVMKYFSKDDAIGKSLSNYGEWAMPEIELLLSLVEPGDVVVDAGANIGMHTLAFASKIAPTGMVHSFERQPLVFDALKCNVLRNGVRNTKLYHTSLGSPEGVIGVPRIDVTRSASLRETNLTPFNPKIGLYDTASVRALDDIKLSACGLIKIGAESMSATVVAGATETIRKLRPFVFCEANTIRNALRLIDANPWLDYKLFFVRSRSFRENNFKNNSTNIFPNAWESAVLAAPAERTDSIGQSIPNTCVISVDEPESLVKLILATPRYGDATEFDRNPEILLKELQRKTEELETMSAELNATIAESNAKTIVLSNKDRLLNAKVAELNESNQRHTALRDAHARQAFVIEVLEHQIKTMVGNNANHYSSDELRKQLTSVLSSTSWRVTAPMRVVSVWVRRALGMPF
jgi:FkbM family methyltransferase